MNYRCPACQTTVQCKGEFTHHGPFRCPYCDEPMESVKPQKVIVIFDSDGHATVMTCTVANLQKMAQFLEEIGALEDNESQNENGFLTSPNSPYKVTAEELIEFLEHNSFMNARGSQFYVLEIKEEWTGCNPFN